MTETIELARKLIQIDSVTPDDKGCQDLIAYYLQSLGFKNEFMPFGEVSNLWSRLGENKPCLVFAGHTDVVPTGPESSWTHPPFAAHIDGDMLYGRGAADMKSSIACFMAACKRFLTNYPNPKGSIAFLITSDEEGPAVDGTVKVIEKLEEREEKFEYCLVGEPSSSKKLADSIKNGRRGSLSGALTVKGIQGHIAYPELADNPIHNLAPALEQLVQVQWDHGNEYFPPTSFQISNINGGTGATNVIPGEVTVLFNFRFSTEHTAESLQESVHAILDLYNIDYEIEWTLSGHPFITEADGDLIKAVNQSVKQRLGYEPKLSTGGGTSDGRFIAPTGAEVIELGPLNATIHKVDECVSVTDLNLLTDIYYDLLVDLIA
ncbi:MULTISPECIES: succinyl-diaminopimelate desuccinylase [Thiomicrorhabdus]|uniref:Succinyl-diaminopimelate desuccinylase n=1 Tax=Thiomicrorhabdus heinhorstiae TaxID=2748010 RepID=A0ABS0BSF8_9GAMM|nr:MULTISPECIES: succinyl-diaminopimelate desuccinylase [Thiomicrorhabdus]MBF6056805.1 succinyl-diaminopimelate desuccinylase [Thiomicrorhabdus heinhorstiae]